MEVRLLAPDGEKAEYVGVLPSNARGLVAITPSAERRAIPLHEGGYAFEGRASALEWHVGAKTERIEEPGFWVGP
jgi:hypothetical protein